MIHPSAIIHPKAKVDNTVSVGPHSVIDEGVELGANCVVGPNVYLTGLTQVGTHNIFFAGSVIGEAPQDLKYGGEPTRLVIGENNVFREHTTVHRSSKSGQATRIGSNNFLMQHSHVAHDVQMGNHVILAGGALLAGFVTVQDRAFISGNCLVHQFTRVGTLALMQGGSAISKDLPPYTVARGHNGICGLNTIGLRRAGIPSTERLELKRVYQVLFRQARHFKTGLALAQKEFTGAAARVLIDFVAEAKRGICADVRHTLPEESESQEMEDI
jgi:UDP-N-acetylglucosamine acyltransferase